MKTDLSHTTLSDELKENNAELKGLLHKIKTLEEENRLLRTSLDTTERRLANKTAEMSASQALQLAELIIENSPAILFRRLAAEELKERRMVYVSPNISRFGYRAEDFLSNKMMFRDIVFPADRERISEEIRHYVEHKIESYTQHYRIVTATDEVRWVEDRTSIVEEAASGKRYHQGIVIDIHKRKEAEEKLRRSEEKYRRIVETAGEGFLLMDKSLAIIDLNTAYARLVKKSRHELIGQKPFAEDSVAYSQFWTTDSQENLASQYHEFECHLPTKNGRKVPVLIHANALRSDSGKIIGNMAFVTDMTMQKKALSLAGEVQRSLLPEKAPKVHGLDIAGRNVPCDEVGGDYFDFLWETGAKESPITVVVGDISGHGVDSALLMSSARAFLRMRSSQPGTLLDIVTDMNGHMTEDVHASGRFMTLFYLTIDRANNSMAWIRAGHDPALFYCPVSDRFEELKGPGLALGVRWNYTYQVQRMTALKKGQMIIIGTDGIWEGRSSRGEMFGKKRLQEIIRHNRTNGAQAILNAVFTEHAAFTKGMQTEDDITLVIIKLT